MISTLEVTFIFPNEEEKQTFLGWMSDGGGEYEFMEFTDTKVNRFIYSKDKVELLVRPYCHTCGDYMPEGHTCQ